MSQLKNMVTGMIAVQVSCKVHLQAIGDNRGETDESKHAASQKDSTGFYEFLIDL